MTIVATVAKRTKLLGLKTNLVTVTLDDSYPTGGEAITAAQLGLTTIDMIIPQASGGYTVEYDYVNNKIILYVAAGTQAASLADLSAVTVRLLAIGL